MSALVSFSDLSRVLLSRSSRISTTSQWDIGLFDTEPFHISIKAGYSPKYTRQPAIIEVAASMIIELEKRGLIKRVKVLGFTFISVKKSSKGV